ncbi:heparin lyase I family protein [Luteipulveratus mongoliensis]|uniref:heparin lyase I family protein n=1 Tax=Luteipulveratus mongoliensis TaxID=571913 RepID=UPI00146FF9B1|nr:heparin lyase I family protein [Luteipulveratus mongoliensis]
MERTCDRRTMLQMTGLTALTIPLASGGTAAASVSPRAPGAAQRACGSVVFTDGFKAGTFDQWSERTIDGNGSMTIVPSPTDSAAKVARFSIPNDGVSFRSEVARKQFTYGRYRYTVSHFIPEDWVPYKYETIVSQWHGYNIDGVNFNPPIALSVHGAPEPKWMVRIFRMTYDSDGTPVPVETRYLPPAPIRYGAWNDWVFDITWSTSSSDGLVVATHNGSEVLRAKGENNYHQQDSPYFQMGVYRSTWRPGNTEPTGGPDVVVYHRGVSITDLRECV